MPEFVERAGVPLAVEHRRGRGPTIVFLPGYGSDMAGGKATALDGWAEATGRAMLRFDYAGCGASGGRFEDGTIESWRDDALAAIATVDGPLILVGSSMGGWIALLCALALGERVAGLVGIAAAPDFTDWGYSEEQKATLHRDGRLLESSPYSDQPTLTTLALWKSGERVRLLGGPIPLACPVRLLHGQADADVPWAISLRIADAVGSADVQTVLVKDGDHRLSREQDIALLIATIETLLD